MKLWAIHGEREGNVGGLLCCAGGLVEILGDLYLFFCIEEADLSRDGWRLGHPAARNRDCKSSIRSSGMFIAKGRIEPEQLRVALSFVHGVLLLASSVTYSPLAVSNFHIVLEAERVCILIVSEFASTSPCRTSSYTPARSKAS